MPKSAYRSHSPSKILASLFATALFLLMAVAPALADNVYGTIRGTVSDQSGASIPNATVIVTNTSTGVTRTSITTQDGSFDVENLLAPGTYDVIVTATGFTKFTNSGIQLNVNQVYVANATLQVGATATQVTVEANPAQINTTSMELGTTITGSTIVDLPLNGRNWIQLQQLQPGVVGGSDRFGTGAMGTNFSTNGSETQQNAFLVNGVDSADISLNAAGVIPSPDAIGEFHMVTSTINPEYGRNSGAIMNAVIKNGTNAVHGDLFEFYRDTGLDARNFFQSTVNPFHQNQFGGTVGGPVYIPHVYNGKDKTFFFFSYQGTRNSVPEGFASGVVPTVYSSSERSGDFSSLPSFYNPANPEPVNSPCGPNYNGPFGPNPLAGNLGSAAAGTPYCVAFPTGVIPTTDLNPLAVKLMNQFVPLPNAPANTYTFNPTTTGLDDQYITRIDENIRPQDSIWGYWLWERTPNNSTLPFAGASLPGFAQVDKFHAQQYALAWNHIFSGTTLNEARFGYFRFNFNAVNPVNPINPTSYGFTGINPQNPSVASLPVMGVTGLFTLGFSEFGPQPRLENTYQAIDNFSKLVGRHSFKAGFTMNRYETYNPFYAFLSGFYSFAGAGAYSSGNAGADFLLGEPDSYVQTNGSVINARSREYYSYVQDEFKVRPNITLTFGTGWDIETPYQNLYYSGRDVNAFRPGQQSTVFPTAPVGMLWPGDRGINSTGGVKTPYTDFAPRLGIAWSPGSSQRWSVHAGVGMYYNRTEEELALQNLSTPPFSVTSFGVGGIGGSPSLANPYVGSCGGAQPVPCSATNPFPYTAPPPGAAVNFAALEPMTLNVLSPNFGVPVSENYNLTVERQLSGSMTLSVAYVGNVAHHLEGAFELNPAGQAGGLNPAAVAAGCTAANLGTCAPTTFRYNPLTSGFAAINQQATDFNSNYNSLQVSVNRHFSHGLEFLAAYTWSRYFDQNSTFDNQAGFVPPGINPFSFTSMYAPSDNDAPQRFVLNYDYTLPFYHFVPRWRPLTDGWKLVSIVTFQHGFPVLVSNSLNPSDTCWSAAEVVDVPCWDRPDRVSGVPLNISNPRNNTINGAPNYWFNPAAFTSAAPGTGIGNSSRNPFYGPGINNFDMALLKDIHFSESKYMELRFEAFNTFNHAQFGNPVADVNNPNFGRVQGTFTGSGIAERVLQLSGKVYF
ncbi:MAG TPA: carboxypeptidase-like regulatory domain-containing protein [Terriglobia bacterium]|nr:carboxypeptidase-like regulatory domain-containing protein [Terriglobia bacterium]